MSEETNTDEQELETLRALRTELLTRTQTQKARITELESEALLLTEKADKAVATMRAAVIDLPMQRLAAEVSPVPELWLAELVKDYTIEAQEDGTLSLLSKDGKPVMAAGHKPIEFTHNALYQLLVGVNGKAETDRAKVFSHLMNHSGASGGVGRKAAILARLSASADPADKKDLQGSFGLR